MQPRDPFEKHPASPLALENRADTFIRLAAEATDQQAVTDHAFEPAVAAWDGVAAPELRDAPTGLRGEAADVASKVAWAAVPLRAWADHVRTFNHKVDGLIDEYAQVSAQVNRHVRQVFPEPLESWPQTDLDAVRSTERQRLVGELHRRYYEALNHHIDEGQTDVAAMFRNGPTLDSLAYAQGLGVLPAGPMAEFFNARWEMKAALDEAVRITEAINDPDYRPTQEELELLDDILSRFADNDEFSHDFLLAIGPQGFIDLNGNLALLPAGPNGVNDSLAELVGSIQAGLGVALATATTRRGTGGDHPRNPYQPGEHELPEQWIVDLMRAGREKTFYIVPDGDNGYMFAELYGHQLLAVLLQSPEAEFDPAFLNWIGTDIYHFEQANGGSSIWSDTRTQVGWSAVPLDEIPSWLTTDHPEHAAFPLNWIAGGAGNDGYDPMVGLLDALERDPDASRDFFTSTTGSGGSLPRLEYLLAEREWPPDYQHHYDGPHDAAALGYEKLGHALEVAVVADPADAKSIQIVESSIDVLYRNLSGDDMIPPTMRESMANMVAPYITDINELYRVGSPDLGGLGIWQTGGSEELQASYRSQVDRLLIDLGKNEQAAATISEAQLEAMESMLEHYLTVPGLETSDRLEDISSVLAAHADVMASLDRGLIRDWDEATAAELAAINDRMERERAVVEVILQEAVGFVPAVGPVLSPTLEAIFAASGGPEGVELDQGQRDQILLELKNGGRSSIENLVTLSVYAHVPLDDPLHEELMPGLPPELVEAKQEGRAWTEAEWAIWDEYLGGNSTLGGLGRDAVNEYLTRFPD